MSVSFTARVFVLLVVTSVLGMYQETPAQRKPAKKSTAETVAKPTPADIVYTVSMPRPATHLLEVEMRVSWKRMPARLELKMPVWTPGSYLVREYARHVQDFSAKDASGRELAWEKVNKNTWAVTAKGLPEVVVTYRVYANELTVRTNELNDEHAFWNNAATLMFVKGQLKTAATLKVNPFGNWKVATGLAAVPGQTNTFRADNFDILYDSPFEVSDFKEIAFTVEGKPHRFVFTGDGNYDMQRIAADTAKIIEEAYKIFGELPYNDYLFIVNLRGGGGLEHMNSTALQFPRFNFKPETRYRNGFLGLVAHELFHVFNVKAIRPDSLGPFDYENENYTKMLWFAEGGTEYYSNLLLRRAGLITDREYLDARAAGFKALFERPGRLETSLEDASFDAWIKYYRQDENAVNNQISYYDKGELVTMMLDLTIRGASGGAKSLDDVMRQLYSEFYKKGRNYSPADVQRISETMAGKPLDDFFDKYVRGTAEIDVNPIVAAIGIDLKLEDVNSGKAYIGADLSEDAATGRLVVRSLPANTPAYEQGLNTGDQIVAVDGYRASQSFLTSYLDERKPGDKVRLTLFRFDKLRDVNFTLGSNERKVYSFERVAEPTDQQRKLYREYLNADL